MLYVYVQARNWKLTEAVEEVPVLQHQCAEASERVESLEGNVKQLQETLERERKESQERISEIEARHQDEKKVLTTYIS